MHKSIQVLILIFILTLVELFTSNNTVFFSTIKAFGIILLIGMVKTIIKQYKLKNILPIAIILFLIPSVYAVDNPSYAPSCINPSYNSGYIFDITEQHATLGNVTSAAITAGYLSPKTVPVYNGINILCAQSDPTVSDVILDGTARMWGVSADGSVWYTDTPSTNYSLGFYSILYWNPTVRVYTITPSVVKVPIAIDGEGNVYFPDGLNLIKLIKELDYSPQIFYTLTSPTDYVAPTKGGTCTVSLPLSVQDIQIDSNANIHVLVGSAITVGSGTCTSVTTGLTESVISPTGSHVRTELLRSDTSATTTTAGYTASGMVLDSIGTNITYAYYNRGGVYLQYYNGTSSSSLVGSGSLTGITSLSDIAYYNYQIYLASPTQNLIRSYVTLYAGYTQPGLGGGAPAELTYDISTITSEQTTYANNSQIQLYNNIQFTTSLFSTGNVNDYRWKTELNDPSGLMVASHFSEYCTKPFFSLTCSLNETLLINPPVTNWTAGIYTAYLKEYNVNSYALATLDSVTFTVLNTSSNNTGVTITTPITSGTGITTLNQWDEYVSFLGWGVNPISRLFFALMIITIVGLIGMKLAGGDAAMVGAFAPYIFFTYIEFIPKWIFIILVLMLVLKSKIFR